MYVIIRSKLLKNTFSHTKILFDFFYRINCLYVPGAYFGQGQTSIMETLGE